MRTLYRGLAMLGVAASVSGCSLTAPQYTASLPNVQKLKDAGSYTATVGKFESSDEDGNANPISLRGSSLNSPYRESYADYLAEAMRQEFSLAERFGPGADIEVSGVLKKNDLHASGFVTGTGDIEALFVVKKSTDVRYEAVKSAHIEWESSFAGAIAIPRAQQSYPLLVQKLLSELYADPAFTDALK